MVNGYVSGASNVVSVGGLPVYLGQMQPIKNLLQKRGLLRSYLLEELCGESPGADSPAAVQKLFDICWNPVFAMVTAAVATTALLHGSHCAQCPRSELRNWHVFFSSQQHHEGDIPILQMRKSRLKEVNWLRSGNE